MKTKIISIILFIILIITTTTIAGDIKPFQLTTSNWLALQKIDKENVCAHYLIVVFKQNRLKPWVRKNFLRKHYFLYMTKKLSKLISTTIINERYISNNIFKISVGEMVIQGWL